MTAFCCMGFAGNIAVGYSNGEVTESSNYTIKGKGKVSAAVYVTPELFARYAGNEVRGIRAGHCSVKYCDSLVVWVKESLDGDNVAGGIMKRGDAVSPKAGWNEVMLDAPYALQEGKGFYIGFTYCQRYQDATVSVVGAPIPNTSFLKRGPVAEWEDISDAGVVSLEMLIGGDNMPQVDLKANASMGSKEAAGVMSVVTTITNNGQKDAADYDLTFSADGYNYVYKASTVIASGQTAQVTSILYDVPDAVGLDTPLTVTISRVGEGEDAYPADNAVVVGVKVQRNVLIEEFTGTGCGWCPRGLVGMDKMHDKYGLKFVGIGIHGYNSTDPMYPQYKNIGLNSAPSCLVDRDYETDPYYGSDNIDICHDVDAEMAKGSMVAVDVKGEYNEDKTEVNITATIRPYATVSGASIGFVLTADGLTGTSSSWKQSNYYTQYSASQLPPDLAQFGAGGEKGTSTFAWVYNDVAIASYKEGSNWEMSLGSLAQNESRTVTATLKMPTKQILLDAIIYEKVAANVFVLNSSGKAINAARSYVTIADGIKDVNAQPKADLREVARYTLDGRMITAPQKGVNIVRLSDGSTIKVNVR